LIRTAAAALVVTLVAAALYFHRLDYAPPHLEIDEVLIGLEGRSIAETGRDLSGERLPLYAATGAHSWYQPLVIYMTAAAVATLGFSEWAIRVPTVCVAIASIVLMFFAARAVTGHTYGAVAGAVLFALTPGLFIHSRYAMDYVYPVVFALAWFLCLAEYATRPRTWLLVLGGTILGVGFYSYIASIVMMPIFAMLTVLFLYLERAPKRAMAVSLVAFLPWLLPFAVWLHAHPTAFGATMTKYAVYDTSHYSLFQGFRSLFLSYPWMSDRMSRYWNFFNPAFLFFGGGIKLMFSTNLVGIFLMPMAIVIAAGMYAAAAGCRPIELVALLGFLSAPIAAALVGEENAIFRGLTILPFGVLLATVGAQRMARGTVGRVALAALAVVAVVQFSHFWTDYFGDYRIRSAAGLGGNIAGAVDAVLAHDAARHAPAFYVSTLRAGNGSPDGRNEYIDAYWRFYAVKAHRTDVPPRTHPFDPAAVDAVSHGSLVLANVGDPTVEPLVRDGRLKVVETVPELDHTVFFEVLER
jgi:4-amino-4-deoxy-L-arabinose transferase-like glycosyltransferase